MRLRRGRDYGRRAGQSERGSGTVLALAILLAISSLLVAAVLYGAVVIATHRARSAADLAALAASARLLEGDSPGVACAQAARVAQVNGGRILACRVAKAREGTVETEVGVELPRACRGLGSARAVARAGPPPEARDGPPE
ncbi:MAG: flp pilus-assembly TadE/G-like family protein [Micrococcales bacterium]|nr:flp pilus-assembly TadE/G-like family protein [Micrococcales bacterium]